MTLDQSTSYKVNWKNGHLRCVQVCLFLVVRFVFHNLTFCLFICVFKPSYCFVLFFVFVGGFFCFLFFTTFWYSAEFIKSYCVSFVCILTKNKRPNICSGTVGERIKLLYGNDSSPKKKKHESYRILPLPHSFLAKVPTRDPDLLNQPDGRFE